MVDGTLGGAGHARAFCERLSTSGALIGFDRDRAAVSRAHERLADCACRVYLREANFRDGAQLLEELSFTQVNKVLLDLGVSSHQLLESKRGFSFTRDEPLVMTFAAEPSPGEVTAYDVVNAWQEDTLRDILWGFGGERHARRIAAAIATARAQTPIETARQLAEVIAEAVPKRYAQGRLHPATRTFQAIRMAVNDELGALAQALPLWRAHLAEGGRLAVISFHSGEDRIVKRDFGEAQRQGAGRVLTAKPITPSAHEQERNVRARSAKLRIFEAGGG